MSCSMLGRSAFAVGIALSLGFGARQALASLAAPAAAIICEEDWECQEYCELKYPGRNVRGFCKGHCICLF